jgi:signal peptidase II
MKQRIRHFIYFIILIALDQLTKYWVRTTLMGKEPIVLIPDVLKLQYHENTGAVWGIMSGNVEILAIVTLIILSFITFIYLKIPQDKKYNVMKVIFVFIAAGAVGNLIDRIFLKHVVDFIYFELIDFPLFNVADSYITVSCVLILVLFLFYYKDRDFEFLDELFKKKEQHQEQKGNEADTDEKANIENPEEDLDDSDAIVDEDETDR